MRSAAAPRSSTPKIGRPDTTRRMTGALPPALLLNLGLRYDLYTNPTEEHNRQSNFDLASGTLVTPGEAAYPRSLVNTSTNNLGPRFGFAYDPFKMD